MADSIEESVHRRAGRAGCMLNLGLALKEDAPDLRNSKVADLVAELAARRHEVTVHAPCADASEAEHEYGLILKRGALSRRYDMVVLAGPYPDYVEMDRAAVEQLVQDGRLFANLKNAFGGDGVVPTVATWTL